jgi:hypothetical protein
MYPPIIGLATPTKVNSAMRIIRILIYFAARDKVTSAADLRRAFSIPAK